MTLTVKRLCLKMLFVALFLDEWAGRKQVKPISKFADEKKTRVTIVPVVSETPRMKYGIKRS